MSCIAHDQFVLATAKVGVVFNFACIDSAPLEGCLSMR